MDLTTLMTVAGLFLSIVVGNAAILGESLFASISVPKAVETSGLDRATAERLFAAQVAWYARLPSILPTPSVSTSSAPSVAMALAKPIQLGDLVYSVQTQLRTDVVSANGERILTCTSKYLAVRGQRSGKARGERPPVVPGAVVSIKERSRQNPGVVAAVDSAKGRGVPEWLELNSTEFTSAPMVKRLSMLPMLLLNNRSPRVPTCCWSGTMP